MRKSFTKLETASFFRGNTKRYDIEKFQEELQRTKIQYNQLSKAYSDLKVEYNKLEKDYRYNIKFMEVIIKKANISSLDEYLDNDNKIENDKNGENSSSKNNFSKETIKMLMEKSLYEKLKLEIYNYKEEIKEKEKIINDLKDNIKVSKYKELDTKYIQIFKELNEVKSRNLVLENLQNDYLNSKNQIIFLLQQIELYKKENKKQKEEIEKLILSHKDIVMQKAEEDSKKSLEEIKVKNIKADNEKLKKKMKELEGKNLLLISQIENLKIQNSKQNRYEKVIFKKDCDIRKLKTQISELKIEIVKLQKLLEENTKSPKMYKKIKKVKNNQGMEKASSDFFLTSHRQILSDNKKPTKTKISINSKDITQEKEENKKIESATGKANSNYKTDVFNHINNNIGSSDTNVIIIKGGQNEIFSDNHNQREKLKGAMTERIDCGKNNKIEKDISEHISKMNLAKNDNNEEVKNEESFIKKNHSKKKNNTSRLLGKKFIEDFDKVEIKGGRNRNNKVKLNKTGSFGSFKSGKIKKFREEVIINTDNKQKDEKSKHESTKEYNDFDDILDKNLNKNNEKQKGKEESSNNEEYKFSLNEG